MPKGHLLSIDASVNLAIFIIGPPTPQPASYNKVRMSWLIDLFADTAAILNLFDLRSIIGCTGGTRSVFMCAFGRKENFNVYF